ncbi:hypothetical protein VP01_1051g1 [Puccinia sorghi]|uniref:Uncharacterized protein n=1 Tax=Puccinia sorghi TaxID=27349 RepID=A0A0L6VUD6_9BASI|nr:hypothetical protein VP01_1051g1 [Puccinia sorghi]
MTNRRFQGMVYTQSGYWYKLTSAKKYFLIPSDLIYMYMKCVTITASNENITNALILKRWCQLRLDTGLNKVCKIYNSTMNLSGLMGNNNPRKNKAVFIGKIIQVIQVPICEKKAKVWLHMHGNEARGTMPPRKIRRKQRVLDWWLYMLVFFLCVLRCFLMCHICFYILRVSHKTTGGGHGFEIISAGPSILLIVYNNYSQLILQDFANVGAVLELQRDMLNCSIASASTILTCNVSAMLSLSVACVSALLSFIIGDVSAMLNCRIVTVSVRLKCRKVSLIFSINLTKTESIKKNCKSNSAQKNTYYNCAEGLLQAEITLCQPPLWINPTQCMMNEINPFGTKHLMYRGFLGRGDPTEGMLGICRLSQMCWFFRNYFIRNMGRLKRGILRDLTSIPGMEENIH